MQINTSYQPTIMVAYQNVEGHEHQLLDFHVPTKALFSLQVLVTERLKNGFQEEEVNKWAWIQEDESSYLTHTNPIPPNYVYIRASLSLFPLHSSGRVDNMETHPQRVGAALLPSFQGPSGFVLFFGSHQKVFHLPHHKKTCHNWNQLNNHYRLSHGSVIFKFPDFEILQS